MSPWIRWSPCTLAATSTTWTMTAGDARRVVDRVGVDLHALQRRLDPPALGEAQVAALGHHAAAQLAAVDAHRVVRAVADVGVRLARGLDVGADAAVVEQVDGRAQRNPNELRRCQRGDVAFIEKPFTAEKLLLKIREVIGPKSERREKVG